MTYLDWLGIIAMPDGEQRSEYSEVLTALYRTPFTPLMAKDENRARDGESLRIEYENISGEECGCIGECSMLEMMVAMAIRCEEQIMYDPEEGDRTAVWFWEMFENLGLASFQNGWFDKAEFQRMMSRFSYREYDSDGYGGMFYIPNFEGNMKKIELWYQLGFYMESKFL